MAGTMHIHGVAMPLCVPTQGPAQQWLDAMPPTRLQGLAASGPVSQRTLIVEAIADYEGFEHAAFRAVVDGGTNAAPFLAAMESRERVASVLTDLGLRADAIHITDRTYIARTAQIARHVQEMTDGADLLRTIGAAFSTACRVWHGGGVDACGLGLRPAHFMPTGGRSPLSANESVRLVMEGNEGHAGHCVEIGIRTALLASAMAAFCPELTTQCVEIAHVSINGSKPAAHVFASVRTPTTWVALDFQNINWSQQKTNPYYSTGGRIGALASWYNNLGIASVNRDLAQQLAAIRTAVMLWPDNASLHQDLAHAYIYSHRFGDAAAAATEAVRLAPSHAPIHLTIAFLRTFQGRLDEAQQCIDTTMRLAPHDPYVLTQCGMLLLELSCWQKAAEAFAAALVANPGCDEARQHLTLLMQAHRDVRVRVPSRPGGGRLGSLANAAFHVSTLGMFRGDDD